MSAEVQCRFSVHIRTGEQPQPLLEYQNYPTAFNVDMVGRQSQSPGALVATLAGIDVDFSKLATLGLVWIKNMDPTNFITYGVRDPITGVFYPWGECPPLTGWAVYMSRFFSEELGTNEHVTGTGAKFHVRADTAPCNFSVEGFAR